MFAQFPKPFLLSVKENTKGQKSGFHGLEIFAFKDVSQFLCPAKTGKETPHLQIITSKNNFHMILLSEQIQKAS